MEDFDYLGPNFMDRVQAALRLLEDHGNVLSTDGHHVGVIEIKKIFAVKIYLSTYDFTGGVYQTQDGKGGNAFAAARFTHQP